jgi:hypothetical protein
LCADYQDEDRRPRAGAHTPQRFGSINRQFLCGQPMPGEIRMVDAASKAAGMTMQ